MKRVIDKLIQGFKSLWQLSAPIVIPDEVYAKLLMDHTTKSVLAYVIRKLAVFSGQIANELKFNPNDVEKALARLVSWELVSEDSSEYGIPGSIYCPTEAGVKVAWSLKRLAVGG